MISFSFDIGTRSIGAAIFEKGATGHRLLWSGVTIFGVPNRQKNLLKTTIKRRKRRDRSKKRKLKVRKWLEDHDLCPQYNETPERNAFFRQNPHKLFEKGMLSPLSNYELGRVLHHFSNHRGWSHTPHGACRKFKEQRKRLDALLKAQLHFQEAQTETLSHPSKLALNKDAMDEFSKLLFEKYTAKRCPYTKSEVQLQESQPLAELAHAALALSKITYWDPISDQEVSLNTQIRSHFLAQLMLGKIVDHAAIAAELKQSISQISWSQKKPLIVHMPTTQMLAKAGYFGKCWNRLSINQQDHLITAIIDKDQAKLIQFWPNALPFSPKRLDRLLTLSLPNKYTGFGPSRAHEIIQHVLKKTPLTKAKKKNQGNAKLFEQVFKRLLKKMTQEFAQPTNIIIESPDRVDARPQKNMRQRIFEMHYDRDKGGVMCPYTGRLIRKDMIYSEHVELDHINPKACGGGDDRNNLTLSMAYANREKADRTPFEAFGHHARWKDICERINNWPMEKQVYFKARNRPLKRERNTHQNSLDMTTHFARKAKEITELICRDTSIMFISSRKIQRLRAYFTLPKDPNDLRHHALDAGLIYLFYERKTHLSTIIAQQIMRDTKPVFVATNIGIKAKSGALSHYHTHLDITAKCHASKWQIEQTSHSEHVQESEDQTHLIMRVKKGDILYVPYHHNEEKFLRVFRLQPSNNTIALGAPYLAGRDKETPLMAKNASQLQKLGAVKCYQKPLGYGLPNEATFNLNTSN